MKKGDCRDQSLGLSFDISRTFSNFGKNRGTFTAGGLGIALTSLLIALLWGSLASAQSTAPFTDFSSYVHWMQKNHKAPFDRDGAVMPPGAAAALRETAAKKHTLEAMNAAAITSKYHNVQVNQDRNPWPKAELGSAIDPSTGTSWVVMANDFRENYDHEFYHVSTNNGQAWTDDSMVGGNDPFSGFIPLTFQSDPGVSFDSAGNSYLSDITGNLIFDASNLYENLDTEIDAVQGFSHGTYTSLLPTPIDDQPCNGVFTGTFNCPGTLDKPFIATDSNPNSPNQDTTYVYYTYFCNSSPCTDGTATIPAFGSAILVSRSPGPGQPFSAPALVSGTLTNTQFSDLVIDASGTPHIFFDDFTDSPTINMWESTLTAGKWVVSKKPVASFVYHGLLDLNWAFRDSGAAAPGCGIHGYQAYCAFSANQVAGGKLEGSPSVYLASISVKTGASKVVRVNSDAFNDLKEHFFAWATATPTGAVYVGWYDSRNDPFNTKVQYFVAKSTDGGNTFPVQVPVSDVAFDPCTGFPGCGFFGDYTQLVSGPDGVVHAAWSDTRDGASMQIWSETITW
ncbi:MAG TPA: hypothetical protein VK788_00085 [Terriglobales bacterium]|nr:hypothetical protein [Terriglobales bacterium]